MLQVCDITYCIRGAKPESVCFEGNGHVRSTTYDETPYIYPMPDVRAVPCRGTISMRLAARYRFSFLKMNSGMTLMTPMMMRQIPGT
jgi:hypothetical protein